jgi:pimeloyl-ACP methyl ester carboxylesterase
VPTISDNAGRDPVSRHYSSQGLRLHYADWGGDGKPLLLLVHGGRDHCRSWDFFARAFRDDFHVVAPDLRGHGESEWARGTEYSTLEIFTDLALLLEQLDRFPVTIVGHSFGGTAAAYYAGVYPERVAAFVGADCLGTMLSRMDTHRPPVHERFRSRVAKLAEIEGKPTPSFASVDEAFRRHRERHPAVREEIARHFVEHGLRRDADGRYRWRYDPMFALAPLDFTYREADTLALWARIDCPKLFVSGDTSMFKEPWKDPRVRAFEGARFELIRGASHQIHHDAPEVFERHVRDFLNDVGAARRVA